MYIYKPITVNVERFTGLNIRGFSPIKFFTRIIFHDVLTSCDYCLTIAKYSWENLHGTLKNYENHESLAQGIFPCLRYIIVINKNLSLQSHLCN